MKLKHFQALFDTRIILLILVLIFSCGYSSARYSDYAVLPTYSGCHDDEAEGSESGVGRTGVSGLQTQREGSVSVSRGSRLLRQRQHSHVVTSVQGIGKLFKNLSINF